MMNGLITLMPITQQVAYRDRADPRAVGKFADVEEHDKTDRTQKTKRSILNQFDKPIT